ncbi:hypothetical protein BJX96DRAFT_183673 [Aspergillus floccosus]
MRPEHRNDFTIAIIGAVSFVADAVETLFDDVYDRLGKYYGKQQGDGNAYINGRIGNCNVVLCYIPGIGRESTARAASSLQISYTGIELALVVGICGGAPTPINRQEIYLGDVIISDSVIEYDFNRQYPSGFQRKSGVKDTLGRPNRKIRTLLNGLRTSKACYEFQTQLQHHLKTLQQTGSKWCHPQANDILFNATHLHKHYGYSPTLHCLCSESDFTGEICTVALQANCDDLECDQSQVVRRRKSLDAVKTSIHIGTIASVDMVVKSSQHRDELVRKDQVIGFEIEGAGIWDNIPHIIVKGVCDYADSHKNKSWQAYAAGTGASAAKTFLEYIIPINKKDLSKTRHWVVPFARNTHFVGRQEEIHRLEELISTPEGPRTITIIGLGGIGKTQVALELTYRMRNSIPAFSIFWISCATYEALDQAYLDIAQRVGIQDIKRAEVKERVKAYLNELDDKWLLVFDDADDIQSTWPHIITTRNQRSAVELASHCVMHVHELDQSTGIELPGKSLIQQSLMNDRHAVISLLEQLAFLPLAIVQAAAYINKNEIAISDYSLLLQEQKTHLALLSTDVHDDGQYRDHKNTIAMTLLITFHQVQKIDRLACEYLFLMACVDPDSIPKSFLPQPKSVKEMANALGLLLSFSLIRSKDDSISLHRLVHREIQYWMKKEEQFSLYIGKTADRLSQIFPRNDFINRHLWREYLPHALFLFGQTEFRKQQDRYTDLIRKVGTCLDREGRYNEAEKFLVQVMTTREQVLGPKHPDTLTSVDDLISTFWNQGRVKEAEELQVQVMETRKEMLGPEHPHTLVSMGNLAATYRDQGQWKEAEELQAEELRLRSKEFGRDHPSTLITMGRLKESEEKEVQVAETIKRLLGPEHPDTLTSMHNLASIYRNQGRWKEAEELQMQPCINILESRTV